MAITPMFGAYLAIATKDKNISKKILPAYDRLAENDVFKNDSGPYRTMESGLRIIPGTEGNNCSIYVPDDQADLLRGAFKNIPEVDSLIKESMFLTYDDAVLSGDKKTGVIYLPVTDNLDINTVNLSEKMTHGNAYLKASLGLGHYLKPAKDLLNTLSRKAGLGTVLHFQFAPLKKSL